MPTLHQKSVLRLRCKKKVESALPTEAIHFSRPSKDPCHGTLMVQYVHDHLSWNAPRRSATAVFVPAIYMYSC
jgi:hypothetical protein